MLGHEPMRGFDAILPLTLAIGVELLMVSTLAPYFGELFNAYLAEIRGRRDSPASMVELSVVLAVGIPILACVTLAVVAKFVSVLTLRRQDRPRFGAIFACASWAYLPLVAKHIAQLAIVSRHRGWVRILTGRVASVKSLSDLAPMTGLGSLVPSLISPLSMGTLAAGSTSAVPHVIDLVNPFDALHIAVFTWLIERGCKVKRGRALIIAVVSWLAWSAIRIAPYY